MRRSTRFDDLDRSVIRYVVTSVRNRTRFYVSEGDGYTDIADRARDYYDPLTATLAARNEEQQNAFGWEMARIVGGTLMAEELAVRS